MSVAGDIVATYRRPGQVMARLLGAAPAEGRALALLMGACLLMFVAQMPRISREAATQAERGLRICAEQNIAAADCDAPREALLAGAAGALMGWIFIAPLLFYTLAWLVHGALRLARASGTASSYGTRLTLFWALLAATPLFLLQGLVAGVIGAGPQMTLVGVAAWAAVLWFWTAGLRTLRRGEKAA